MDKLIDVFIREWETVTAAPITILILVAAAIGIAGQVWKWYYRKQTEDRDARIELLQSQLDSAKLDMSAMEINQAFDAEYYRQWEGHFRGLGDWARKKAREMDGEL